MTVIQKEAIIIGGGPAGLAAAVQLHEAGVRDILIVEREAQLGGILRQCIHDGFGLSRFGCTLSGPEYAQRFVDTVAQRGIPYVVNTTVLALSPDKQVTTVSPEGRTVYQAKAVVLAMGCRERTRGALAIPGERPAGVWTAGVAQSYVNLHNLMIGKRVVILGSGDIGLIMARRLTLEGAQVLGVYEIQPYANGLPRNLHQCLADYNIPLHLSHTVTEIHGKIRLTGVTVSRVDDALRPIPGTEQEIACDTLVLSVGLIPENELSAQAQIALDTHTKGAIVDEFYQTGIPGIFAAGNVLHVHDLVDFVSQEAERLADAVAQYLRSGLPAPKVPICVGTGVGYVLPQHISGTQDALLSLRVRKPMQACALRVYQDGVFLLEKKFNKALPAEMLHLTVPCSVLRGTGTVEVRAE